jgi:hypothetical protein
MVKLSLAKFIELNGSDGDVDVDFLTFLGEEYQINVEILNPQYVINDHELALEEYEWGESKARRIRELEDELERAKNE